MIYAEYLSTSEAQRWIVDADIAWEDIDPPRALEQPDLLDRVRDSALIESFFPIFTPRALDLLWDDVNATAVFSVQLYESYRHFHVLNQYLHAVDYRPIGEDEIVALRRRNLDLRYDSATTLLTHYMLSEHLAAHYFIKDGRKSRERVLAQILTLIGRDEVRHAQFAFDLLALRVQRDPTEADRILEAARHFRHIGAVVVDPVPVSEQGDFAAILTMDQKIHRLTGRHMGRTQRGTAATRAGEPEKPESRKSECGIV